MQAHQHLRLTANNGQHQDGRGVDALLSLHAFPRGRPPDSPPVLEGVFKPGEGGFSSGH